MKKRVLLIIIVVIIVTGGISVSKALTETKPFRNLSANDISDVTVSLSPPGTVHAVNDDEVNELIGILRKMVIYEQDDSYNTYVGQGVAFNITKTDGTQMNIEAFGPCIIIDGVGYKTKDKYREELHRLGNNVTHQEFKYEIAKSDGRVLTESEKSQAAEDQLIDRLQTIIEMFDSVNEAVISMDSSNESEKTVDVWVATKPDTQLTDEEKAGIVNLIKNSISSDLTVIVNLKEESHTN